MLELAQLLLQFPDAKALQGVVDPSTGAPAGFVRPRPSGLWQRWFVGPVLDVYEHEDESLLCVIRSGRFPRRRLVYDADGRWVGAVMGRRLEDRHSCVVALRETDGGARSDVFRDAEGRPLATLQSGRDGVRLSFTEAIAGDPFAKMLVLAAALRG
jgi:hypothetical protein